MLRHCTVTAVKTNITRVSCPSSEGRTNPGAGRMMWVGVQWAVQGFTNATDRQFCASFTTVYVDFKHGDNTSQKIPLYFPLHS